MKIQLPVELFNAIMQVLIARPFAEVHGLIAAIEAQRVIVNSDVSSDTSSAPE